MEIIQFEQLIGFEWDAGNRDKNQIKHQVTNGECEQLFFNSPLIILEDSKHSAREARYVAFGKTNQEKRLTVIFTVRNQLIRIISARGMHKKERVFYENFKT